MSDNNSMLIEEMKKIEEALRESLETPIISDHELQYIFSQKKLMIVLQYPESITFAWSGK